MSLRSMGMMRLAYEQGQLRLVGVGPCDELAARMRGVGPEVQPGPGGEVKLALRRVRGEHRGHQELVAEAVDVLDRIRVGVGLVEQDERADDRQPGRARPPRVGVDVREQADVQPGEELVVGQGLVAEPPGELQLAGDLASICMIGEKQPNWVHRMNRLGGDWLKLMSWYPQISCPQIEYALMAADSPATITLGSPLSPKFGSLSPAQQPGKACEPAKPLRASRTPGVPSTFHTVS